MNYYSFSNNKILIAHFPGSTKHKYDSEINVLKERIVTIPENIDIVSVITDDIIDTCPLHYQLTMSGIQYINPAKDKNIRWEATRKLQLIINGLKESNKEYCLVLDGNDVVILDNLTSIIGVYKTYNVDILYNSTLEMFPNVIVEYIKDRWKYGNYCYLNAGCCIGKTDKLLEFYKEAYDILQKDIDFGTKIINSEQYYIRKAFDNHQDTVFFDYDCKVFQCWHKQEYKYETDPDTGEEKCILL